MSHRQNVKQTIIYESGQPFTNQVFFVGGGRAVFFRDISHHSNGPEEFLWQSFGLHLCIALYRKPPGPEFDGSCTETTSREALVRPFW